MEQMTKTLVEMMKITPVIVVVTRMIHRAMNIAQDLVKRNTVRTQIQNQVNQEELEQLLLMSSWLHLKINSKLRVTYQFANVSI